MTAPAAAAPTVTTQPTAASVATGQTATFSVVASGIGPFTYQWQRDGTAIAGATSASYSLLSSALTDSGANFSVVVTGPGGSVTSAVGVLTITDPVAASVAPTIAVQPKDVATLDGTTATFSVAAIGTGPFSYQWELNGFAIVGATAATYTTSALVVANSGAVYDVVVTNAFGSAASSKVSLTVTPAPVLPALTLQPHSAAVLVGSTATFSAAAGGSPQPTYQWQSSTDGGGSFTPIAGATFSTYTTPPVSLADNGKSYRVLVSNTAGTLNSDTVILTATTAAVADARSHYFLLATAGPQTPLTFSSAMGVQNLQSQALIAVDPANPAAPVIVEPAGAASLIAFAIEAAVANDQISAARSRFELYFKNGRLYALDQLVPEGSTPTPRLLSNLKSSDFCGVYQTPSTLTRSLSDALHSFVYFSTVGTDGKCGSNTVAIRLDMSATDNPIQLPGLPVLDLETPQGGYSGMWVLTPSSQIKQLDADLTNATTVYSDPFTIGQKFGGSSPGNVLLEKGAQLFAASLSAPSTLVPVTTLGANETVSAMNPDGDDLLVTVSISAIVSEGNNVLRPASYRVIRVTAGLTTSDLRSGAGTTVDPQAPVMPFNLSQAILSTPFKSISYNELRGIAVPYAFLNINVSADPGLGSELSLVEYSSGRTLLDIGHIATTKSDVVYELLFAKPNELATPLQYGQDGLFHFKSADGTSDDIYYYSTARASITRVTHYLSN